MGYLGDKYLFRNIKRGNIHFLHKVYHAQRERTSNKKARFTEGNKMVFPVMILAAFFFMNLSYAQDYPILDTDRPGGNGPAVVLPGLAKASAVIVDLFIGSDADHELFLSAAYWPVPLGNNTTLNLTA
jgi:hypothetical protein